MSKPASGSAETAAKPTNNLKRRRHVRVICVTLLICAIAFWMGWHVQPAGPASGVALFGQATTRPSTRPSLRISTFNIHSGIGAAGKRDLSKTARTLQGFDIVALNEVQGHLFTSPASQAEELGNMLDMAWLFAPTERRFWRDDFGNGLLSRLPAKQWMRIPLDSQVSGGCRNVLLTTLQLGDQTIRVLVTHVSRKEQRADHLRAVLDLFMSLQEPAILAGDLNSTADVKELASVLANPGVHDTLRDVMGAKTPARIDWILTRGLKTIDAGIVEEGSSDHAMYWAELEIRP